MAQRLDCSKRCRFITAARACAGRPRARGNFFFEFLTRIFLMTQFTRPFACGVWTHNNFPKGVIHQNRDKT
jgi:hypothetical protein